MDKRLPLKVRVAIRDKWENESAPVNLAREKLQAELGFETVINPEWPQLLAELDGVYADKEDLVVAVAGCVTIWCKAFTVILEEANSDTLLEAWVTKLLDLCPTQGRLRLFIEVAAQAGTSFKGEQETFVLALPRTAVVAPTELVGLFRNELLQCFDQRPPPAPLPPQTETATAAAAGEDWADVEMDKASGIPVVLSNAPGISSGAVAKISSVPKAIPEYLPSVDLLPRPDELLRFPPYHLRVMVYGSSRLEVQCSHGPSLQVLANYLRRWCRVSHNDTRHPPVVEISLHQSCWSSSLLNDSLTLSTEHVRNNTFNINPTIMLALVERVLGYDRVSVDGGVWTYRRDVAFKD